MTQVQNLLSAGVDKNPAVRSTSIPDKLRSEPLRKNTKQCSGKVSDAGWKFS